MSFNTTSGFNLDTGEPAQIGKKHEWKYLGRDTTGKSKWGRNPEYPEAEKADGAGNDYVCCPEGCFALKVNQGPVNAWFFSRNTGSIKSKKNSGMCEIQSRYRKLPKMNSKEFVNLAKDILYLYLMNENGGKNKFNVKDVQKDREIIGSSGVIPSITILHNEDCSRNETYIEIQIDKWINEGSFAGKFYEEINPRTGKKWGFQTVFLSFRGQERGQYYDKIKLPNEVIKQFKRRFDDARHVRREYENFKYQKIENDEKREEIRKLDEQEQKYLKHLELLREQDRLALKEAKEARAKQAREEEKRRAAENLREVALENEMKKEFNRWKKPIMEQITSLRNWFHKLDERIESRLNRFSKGSHGEIKYLYRLATLEHKLNYDPSRHGNNWISKRIMESEEHILRALEERNRIEEFDWNQLFLDIDDWNVRMRWSDFLSEHEWRKWLRHRKPFLEYYSPIMESFSPREWRVLNDSAPSDNIFNQFKSKLDNHIKKRKRFNIIYKRISSMQYEITNSHDIVSRIIENYGMYIDDVNMKEEKEEIESRLVKTKKLKAELNRLISESSSLINDYEIDFEYGTDLIIEYFNIGLMVTKTEKYCFLKPVLGEHVKEDMSRDDNIFHHFKTKTNGNDILIKNHHYIYSWKNSKKKKIMIVESPVKVLH